MSHCSLLELVLKQRVQVSLALMRGGALGLSGLPDLTLGLGCGLISVVVEFPQGHTWSFKAVKVAAGPQGRCSDSARLPALWFWTW